MNFYPFHPGDYVLRTAHLEPLEDLAYRRLLDLYYVNEGPIQGDSASIARLIRMRSNADEVGEVLAEFFEETPEGWRHRHCDEVIAQYQAKARQAAENGKRGGRPRKHQAPDPQPDGDPIGSDQLVTENPEETNPVFSGNPEETGSKANQEPITKTKGITHTLNARADAPSPMTLDWQPDERLLKAYATRAGLPVVSFTHDAIADFVCHYAASGRLETQAAWVSMLVRWVKRDTVQACNVRPFPKRRSNGPDFHSGDISWADELGGLEDL